MDNDDKNVFTLGSVVKGGKTENAEPDFPINDYVVVDIDDDYWYATGFLVFTPHHITIMKPDPLGAVPDLVIPISRVKAAQIVPDDDEED